MQKMIPALTDRQRYWLEQVSIWPTKKSFCAATKYHKALPGRHREWVWID